jgi:hypothetical protein
MKDQPVDISVLTRMLGERELRCELMRLEISELKTRIAEQDQIINEMKPKVSGDV